MPREEEVVVSMVGFKGRVQGFREREERVRSSEGLHFCVQNGG